MGKAIICCSIDLSLSMQLDKMQLNKSELVNRLLHNYLDTFTPEQLEAEIKTKTEILEKQKEVILEKETLTKEKQAKQENRQKEREVYVQKTFLEDLGRELTEEELKEYFTLFDSGLTDYYKYLGTLRNGSN